MSLISLVVGVAVVLRAVQVVFIADGCWKEFFFFVRDLTENPVSKKSSLLFFTIDIAKTCGDLDVRFPGPRSKEACLKVFYFLRLLPASLRVIAFRR